MVPGEPGRVRGDGERPGHGVARLQRGRAAAWGVPPRLQLRGRAAAAYPRGRVRGGHRVPRATARG